MENKIPSGKYQYVLRRSAPPVSPFSAFHVRGDISNFQVVTFKATFTKSRLNLDLNHPSDVSFLIICSAIFV
jgi:hypothetical protein